MDWKKSMALLFASSFMLVIGVITLDAAEAHLALLGARVPDIAHPFGTSDDFRATFEGMSPEARRLYLRALWSGDLAFPLAFAGLMYVLIPPNFGSRWWAMGVLCLDLLCENVIGTVIVMTSPDDVPPHLYTLYALVNVYKFTAMSMVATVAVMGRSLWTIVEIVRWRRRSRVNSSEG